MTRYALARHVCACRADDQVILLDLHKGQYTAISTLAADRLGSRVEGLPTMGLTDPYDTDGDDTQSLLQEMLKQRLICTAAASSEWPKAPLLERPRVTLSNDIGRASRPSARSLGQFLASVITASTALRLRSLSAIVRSIQLTKARHCQFSRYFDFGAAADAVALFDRLRPLAFTAKDKCLHDSLALTHFLARMRIFPQWVIGVRTHPFQAHSWVQEGDVVFNGLHDQIGTFTPIMVV